MPQESDRTASIAFALQFLMILRAAAEAGVWNSGEDYLIPNRRPGAVRRIERSDKVIWHTVKIVAARAGVQSTVHALRAAFAVQFDEANPDQLIALKELMGHSRIETTLIYLRLRDQVKPERLARCAATRQRVEQYFF